MDRVRLVNVKAIFEHALAYLLAYCAMNGQFTSCTTKIRDGKTDKQEIVLVRLCSFGPILFRNPSERD
jgi:hypothetical protein